MPARKTHFSNCGHVGFGGKCHRCAQAEKLEAQAATLKDDERKKLLTEAARLRAKRGEKSAPVRHQESAAS